MIIVDKDGKKITIEFEYNPVIVELIRGIPSAHFNKPKRRWELPNDSYRYLLPLVKVLTDGKQKYILSPAIQDAYFKAVDQYKETKEEQKNAIEIKKLLDIDGDFSYLKIPLRPLQKVAVKFLEVTNGIGLIADRVGLGKSAEGIGYTYSNKKWKTLVVTLATLKYNWVDEIEKFTDATWRIHEGAGSILTDEHYNYTIVNYEQTYKRSNTKDSSSLDSLLKLVESGYFDAIIIDEGQKASNRKSKTTIALHKYFIKIPCRIVLTGTPMTSRPEKLWAILHFLHPELFPDFFSFAKKYCAARRTNWGWDFTGASNLDKLNKILEPIMIRRTDASDLPGKIIKTIRLLMPKNIQNEYLRLESKLLGITDLSKKVGALAMFQTLKQFTSNYKIGATKELIEDFLEMEEDQKVVTFSTYLNPINTLHAEYPESSVLYSGEIDAKQKDQAKKLFQTDPQKRVFLCTSRAAGIGLNGLTVSNIGIIMDYPWNPDDLEQIIGRLNRSGQLRIVLFNILECVDTIDEYMAAQIKEKAVIIAEAIDGTKKPSLDLTETAVMDNLIEIYKKKQAQMFGGKTPTHGKKIVKRKKKAEA